MSATNTIRQNENMGEVRINAVDVQGGGGVADAAALYSRLNRTRKSSRTSPLIYAAPAVLVAMGLGVALATIPHTGASSGAAKIAAVDEAVAPRAAAPVSASPAVQAAAVETAKLATTSVKAPAASNSVPASVRVASNSRSAPRAAVRPELGATTPSADEIVGQPSGPNALAPPPAPQASARPELGTATPPADEVAGQPSGPVALAPPPAADATPAPQPPADQAQGPATAPSTGPVATSPPVTTPSEDVL